MVRISQTRIRTIKHIVSLLKTKTVAFGMPIQDVGGKLQKVGFGKNSKVGDTILPSIVGSVTRYNAEGKEKIRKNLDKETCYRQREWEWKDWGGNQHAKIVDVPYQRYPRDFIPPPGVELTIVGNKIVSPVFHIESQQDEIIHTVNIFLELFGSCDILDENLEDILAMSSRRVNWRILPKGKLPWERMQQELGHVLEKQKSQVQQMFRVRFEAIEKYQPDFHVIGEGGFSGYAIFGFEKKNLFICESLWSGNAIYIFEENWEELSKKTKAEILGDHLQKDRIIHYKDWQNKIHHLLNKTTKTQ